MDRDELTQKILTAIEDQIRVRRLRQKDLLNLCEQNGYTLNQSELSRILQHKIALTLYSAIALCDSLNIDINSLLKIGKSDAERILISPNAFVISPRDRAIACYLGNYHILFHSTDAQEENKILRGRLRLYEPDDCGKNPYCAAELSLDTGETDIRSKSVVKQYKGQFFVSPQMGIAYCLLSNNTWGEVCMVEFRHRTFFTRDVECRVGMALTVSSGEKKLPTAHKMLVFRDAYQLDEVQESQFVNMLKMSSGEVRVDADILSRIPEDTVDRDAFEKLFQVLPTTSGYTVDASLLRGFNRRMSNAQVGRMMALLNEYTENAYSLYLKEEDDSYAYDMIQALGINTKE